MSQVIELTAGIDINLLFTEPVTVTLPNTYANSFIVGVAVDSRSPKILIVSLWVPEIGKKWPSHYPQYSYSLHLVRPGIEIGFTEGSSNIHVLGCVDINGPVWVVKRVQ